MILSLTRFFLIKLLLDLQRKEPLHTTLHFFLRIPFQKSNGSIKGEDLHAILDEIDTNRNGQVELDEYLQVSNNFLLCFHEIF